MTRQIIDACLFAGEADMLELRMRTLAPVVDQFVVVACAMTHQGEPADTDYITRGFVEAVQRARPSDTSRCGVTLAWVRPSRILARGGRVYERSVDERGPAGTRWFQHIEKQHRDGVKGALTDLGITDGDTAVMVSDVDEIPNPDVVAVFRMAWPDPIPRKLQEFFTLAQRFHSDALDLLHPQQPWFGTCISRLETLAPQEQRDARTTIGSPRQSITAIAHGGVHLSWMGTNADRQRKLDTFSHAELRGKFDPAQARRDMLHANGEQLRRLTVEESYEMWWPEPLIDGSFSVPESWVSGEAWTTAP